MSIDASKRRAIEAQGYEVADRVDENGQWLVEAQNPIHVDDRYEASGETVDAALEALCQKIRKEVIDLFAPLTAECGFFWSQDTVEADGSATTHYFHPDTLEQVKGNGPNLHMAHEDALQQMSPDVRKRFDYAA